MQLFVDRVWNWGKAESHNYKIDKIATEAPTGLNIWKLSAKDRKMIQKLNSTDFPFHHQQRHAFWLSLFRFVDVCCTDRRVGYLWYGKYFLTVLSCSDTVNILNVYLCIRNMWQMPQMFVINLIAFSVMFCCLSCYHCNFQHVGSSNEKKLPPISQHPKLLLCDAFKLYAKMKETRNTRKLHDGML